MAQSCQQANDLSTQPADPSVAVEIHNASFAWVDQTRMAKLKTARERLRNAQDNKTRSAIELEMVDITGGTRFAQHMHTLH